MIKCINNNNECIISNRIINEKNKKIKINLINKEMNKTNKQEFIEYLQKNNLFNSVWNKIYLKETIEKNNIRFDKNLMSGEDYKFNLDYFNNIDTAKFINEFLYNYTMNEDSIVHDKKNSDFFLQVKIVDYNKEFYKKNNFNFKKIIHKL